MTKTGIFHIFQQNIKNIKLPIITFLCYLYKGTYKNFLIWSYEDNRLLQLEAVVIYMGVIKTVPLLTRTYVDCAH